MTRIIIFDLDDTLTDNQLLDYQGFVFPCKKLGLTCPSIKKIKNYRTKGFLAQDIAKKICDTKNNIIKLDDFLSIRKEFFNDSNSMKYYNLNKGTRSLLKFLKKNNFKIFLCSVRTNKKLVESFFKDNEIFNFFEKIYVLDDITLKLDNKNFHNRIIIKNSIIHKIVRNLNNISKEIIFVGDSCEDKTAALDNHLQFIHYRNKNKFKDFKVSNRVTDMKSLKIKILELITP